jgi:glycerol-3-phosphate dehydrogenase
MWTAVAVDALIGRDRNDGVPSSRHLAAGRVIGRSQSRELFEGAIHSVASAVVWHDYQTIDGDRLTLSFAKAAAQHGATLANYVEATTPLRDGRRLCGVRGLDALTGQTLEIRARAIVNAAGPWGGIVVRRAGVDRRWPLLKAMNLVTTRPPRATAVVGPARGGRALVLLPWRGRTLVGTSESPDERQPDDQEAVGREVIPFLADVNEAFPALDLKLEEITLVHRGVVPAASVNGRLTLLGHSRIVDHAQDGMPELITIIGVKYTTARAVAERVIDLVLEKLGRTATPCRTTEALLPGAGLDAPDPADPVLQAINEEMAHTLADVVVRRTGLGAAGYPGEAVAADIARRMQQALGWTDQRRMSEIDQLKRFYEIK